MPTGSRLLFLVLLAFPLCGAAQEPVRSITVTWSPTARQTEAWKAAARERPQPPLVSLKMALPSGAGPCRLEVLDAEWQPQAPPNCADISPATLGARGVWRGAAYQELLIHPLEGRAGDSPALLRRLEARLTFALGGSAGPVEATRRTRPARGALEDRPAPPSGLRITLSRDGIYHLGATYLQEHGFDLVGTRAENIRLACRGREIPIAITGPDKKSFGKKNGILFYGQKLAIRDRPVFNGGDFSDENVYWLTADDSAGLRMSRAKAAPGSGGTAAALFRDTVHVEVNNFLAQTYHFRPNGDNWFWAPVLWASSGSPGQPNSFAVDLPHAAAGEAALKVVLAGLNDTEHAVSPSLNGSEPTGGPNPTTWSGASLNTADWTFSDGVQPGENTLSLTLPGFPSHPDFQLLDYFEVSYPRTFDADSGALRFSDSNAKARYVSEGYASRPYVLDLSARDSETGLVLPVLLKGVKFASGKATFEMAAGSSSGERSVALSCAPLAPDSAEVVSGRDLTDPSLGADLLVLTHPRFHPEGQDAEWQAYLERRGHSVEILTVDIQEVFDQFSHGLMDPTAIRSFLAAAAHSWRKAPRYLLLIGDATYDYKNCKADPGIGNWVPTMMFEDLGDWEYMGRYPSDAWYSDLDGDGYPDVSVGRLPARTYEDLAGILEKILAYEEQAAGPWASTVLYVADTYNQPWEQEFEAFSDSLRETFTAGSWTNRRVYFHDPPYGGTDADGAAAAIRASWPCALVHYTGHSGIGAWGNVEKIFTAYPSRNCSGGTCADSDVDLLPPIQPGNAPLPFVLNATCYVSAFDEVGEPCLMEALLASPNGGCVGSAGFSTIAYLDEEEAFSEAVLGMLVAPTGTSTTGDLVDAGRFALPSSNSRGVLGSVLLGDPSLELKTPRRQ